MMMRLSPICVAIALALLLAACGSGVDTPAPPLVSVPSDFPPLPVPADNALTAERVALGKKLFFDKGLSRTGEISCGSCHLQEHAFADPNPVSIGVHGQPNRATREQSEIARANAELHQRAGQCLMAGAASSNGRVAVGR